MPRIPLLLCAMLLALPGLSQAQEATPLPAERAEVAAAAQRLQAKVVAWRRDFHAHPELSNQEVNTSAKVAAALRAMGLKPQTGIANHGVVAIIEGGRPGPKIALRADMDGLPVAEQTGLPYASKATGTYRGERVGVMHACGHDAHMATLLGVAEALVAMKKDLPGQVMLIFQPAEEGGGPLMAAADMFDITVDGRQTHGSAPWNGIDPIVASADLISTAQTIVSRRANLSKQPAVLTFGAIKGGVRNNIIPDSVNMIGTIRTFDDGMRQQVFDELRSVSEHVAGAHGATAKVAIQEGYPATVNDPALTAQMLPSLQAVVGADNVYEPPLQMGAEDFSLFAREVPGMFFFVGSTSAGIDPATAPGNHSPKFLLDEKSLDVGMRALLQVSLDYLNGAGTPAG